jgi:hypothetical protein
MGNKSLKRIYHILLINHGKQLEDLYSGHSEELAYKRFNRMLEDNKKVVFPMRWNNHEHVMKECEYELVMIKKKDESDSDTTKLKNNYGEYVNYESSSDNWIIYDRANYDIEETFWVYGYNPRMQRKDFNWIFKEFVEKDAKDKYKFKSIVMFKNKILFDCNGHLEMVICKNVSDSTRMYNLIEEMAKKKKFKYIAFMGDVTHSKYKMDWANRIKELTHWNNKKVLRSSTRP